MSNTKDNTKSVAIIVPHVVVHNLDPHTGIPFMPHIAAYMAGALNSSGYNIQVIDCFGLQPNHRRIHKDFMLLGVPEQWVANNLNKDVSVVFMYCRTVEDLISTEILIKEIKSKRPRIKVCLFENIQTVNSFSLRQLVNDLLPLGCDAAIFQEPEKRAGIIADSLINNKSLDGIDGIAYYQDNKIIISENGPFDKDLDELPLPLWEKFPLEGYWIAGYSHAPVARRKFLPLLTSRGCPYNCTFCIAPGINPEWRAHSAKNVVDEIEHFNKNLEITDFHISDLNPTVNEKRIQDICKEIIARQLSITWKLAQGTKIETIKNEETLELMAKAGCNFVSFSPETGSQRLLRIVNKTFDQDHALKMVSKMNSLGIKTQACFVAGLPEENIEDRKESINYVKELISSGADEIAVTIFTPLPGAKLAASLEGYDHYSQLTHSPTWRKDYKTIQKFRIKMYLTFFTWKLTKPSKVIREFFGFITGLFGTKMEMALFRQIKLYLLYYVPGIYKKLDPDLRLRSFNE